MSPKLSRRALTGGALGLAGLAAAARYLPGLLFAPSRAESLIHELVSLVALPDPVATGRFYFAAHPGVTAPELVEQVLGELPAVELPVSGTVDELRHAFRQKLIGDFEAGRTIRLDGWVLSNTEARLCALLALEADAPRTSAGA